MDLMLLNGFLNYEPIMDENPQFLVDNIKKKARLYLSDKSVNLIQKAYNFALDWHKWQKRLSWEYYIVHPVIATKFLMEIKPDLSTILACLLHDVIEDTKYEYEDILNNFWEQVANLCISMVKVWKVKYRWEDRQLETLKKTFLAMWEDLRVIFIKLADRIHNVQTLHFHPKIEKRKRIALETLKIYVPIAQRLWLAVFQWYLENWAFQILNSKEFYRIVNYVSREYWVWKKYSTNWRKILMDLLDKNGIKYQNISWRFKSPFRIYKKLRKYGTRDIAKIMDVLAFRIITDQVSDCYNVLWFIHSNYTPIINKIKDYIAVPKINWYKSLHTVVLGMFDFPVEIQIRTEQMNAIAEFWVAAHFAYKESWNSIIVPAKQGEWIQELQDLVNEFQSTDNKEDFKTTLHVELLEKNIFVYTPNWDIIELPKDSTVLDFAFRIHTDVWLKYKNALVNGKPVPIDYEPCTWDIVDIKTYKNKDTASKSWYDYLHTSSWKQKLNRFLKNLERKQYISDWINILNNRLKAFSLPYLFTRNDLISRSIKWEDMDNLLVRIADKQVAVTKLIKEIYKDLKYDNDKESLDNDKEKIKYVDIEGSHWKSNNVIVDKDKCINFIFCPECKPKRKDKIVARVGKDWIKIHSISCKSMKDISLDKLLESHWEWDLPNIYRFELELQVSDKPWILLQVLTIFYDLDISMSDIQVQKWDPWLSEVNIILEMNNPSKSFYVIKELKNKKNLLKIKSCVIN